MWRHAVQTLARHRNAPQAPIPRRNVAILSNPRERRVVVTGIGLVTPLGVGTHRTWENLLASKTATQPLQGPKGEDSPAFNTCPSQVAARVPRGDEEGQFDSTRLCGPGSDRQLAPFMQFAMAAAEEALNDAHWKEGIDVERTGVAFGAGVSSLDDIASTSDTLHTKGIRRVSPYFVPKILINLAAGHISMKYGLQGPNHAVSTACATGAHAIGDAMRFIQYDDADVMICGGTEACIHPLSLAGFSRARALSTGFNDTPQEASRPFDKDRDGFVIGEGAGCLVLEERAHALARGARIYAELTGYGLSGDAHHITAPREDGQGAIRAMTQALKHSSLDPTNVHYINAHATSTPVGDIIEGRAIASMMPQQPYISSIKGSIGHLLGAAGAVEAAATVLALHHNRIPGTVNLRSPDTELLELGVRLVGSNNAEEIDQARTDPLRVALSNSFGFGGTNASLCFIRHE